MLTWHTTYKEEYCQKLLDYFNIKPYEEHIISDKGKRIYIVNRTANQLPYLGKFAMTIGVTLGTMIKWTEDFPEFGETYAMAKELQTYIIVTNALLGLYNATFSAFTLKNISGFRDRQEQVHSGTLSIDSLLNEVAAGNSKRKMIDKT